MLFVKHGYLFHQFLCRWYRQLRYGMHMWKRSHLFFRPVYIGLFGVPEMERHHMCNVVALWEF